MSTFATIKHADYKHSEYLHHDGRPDAIQLFERIEIETSVGKVTPIYEVEDHGRKKLAPIRLFKDGNVKSIALQDATPIPTSVGTFSAELVTFYESGAVCRVFPLNGKLSGYWSELNEYKLTQELAIPTPIGTIAVRPIYFHFYETGEIKSITFWPQEKLEIQTPLGMVSVKRGISFHKNGALASCEPDCPLLVATPLGSIEAFDSDFNGMNGEQNSLIFTAHGELAGLSTDKTVVKEIDGDSKQTVHTPLLQRSRCSDTMFTVEPLKIRFEEDAVVFQNGFRPKQRVSSTAQFSLESFQTEKQIAEVSCCS